VLMVFLLRLGRSSLRWPVAGALRACHYDA
jgi:hypothetical protein